MPDSDAAPADDWQPPWWLLVFAPLCWLLVSALILDRRGWQIALATFVLLAPVGMPIPALHRRLHHHRRLAGTFAGPIIFAATALLTTFPLWLCIATALAALILGLTITTARQLAHHP